jgi:ATP-dependent Clp endopeptidase proteolytic subunit ClpP
MSKKHHNPPPKAIAMIDVRAEGSTAEVLIYDTIGADFWNESVTAKTFAKQVSELKGVKDINVRINSPGGSVFDATAIYNTLKNHPANITVTIEGMALSAASLVAMAGDTIRMASNAYLMIHNPWALAEGDAESMRKAADMLDKVKGQLVKTYAERSGMDETEVANLLDAETWMTADEALEMGFADEVMSQPAIAASVDVKQYSKAPAAFKRMVKASAKPVTQEKPTMADEPKAASIGEIKAACEGATSDFVLAQIEKGATLPQALAAWTAVQAAELKKVKAELDEMKKEEEAAAKAMEEEEKAKAMEEEEKAKAMEEEEKETAAKAKLKTKPGVKPVNNSKPVDTSNGTARDQWNDLVASFKAKHAPARAVSMAFKAAPELHAAMLAEVNAR